MIKKQFSFLLALFCISLSGFSNIKLFPGYFIDLKGDTVRCNIEYNDRNLNPKTIQVQENGQLKEYGPGDIRGFGVFGYHDWISASVSYHMGPVTGPDLPAKYSDSVLTKTTFLQVLSSGTYSLYVLVLPERIYLFDNSPGKPISELVYRVKMENDSLKEDESYKQEINILFMNEGLSQRYFDQISSLSYNASQVTSLFNILNETHSGVKTKKNNGGDFNMDLYIGGIMNTFPSSFSGIFLQGTKFDPSTSVTGGINFLFSIPGHFKAFKVGLSLGYNGYSGSISGSGTYTRTISAAYYYTSIYEETITIKNSVIMSNVYALYLFNPLDKIKVYLKAGLNYNISVGGNKDIITNFSNTTDGFTNANVPIHEINPGSSATLIYLNGTYLAPMVSLGFISGRSKLEFSYWAANTATTTSNEIFSTPGTFKVSSFGLFYYFSLFPVK